MVKALEKKEREWISKLQDAQVVQEVAYDHLESALLKDSAPTQFVSEGAISLPEASLVAAAVAAVADMPNNLALAGLSSKRVSNGVKKKPRSLSGGSNLSEKLNEKLLIR